MRYRWLHISDLHSLCSGIKTDIMKAGLINYLGELAVSANFNFIVITGDISDKNDGYDRAKKIIHSISAATNVPLYNVYIVPGNHDVDRKTPSYRDRKAKEAWNLDMLEKTEDTLIKELIDGQNKFFAAYKEILNREYPRDKVHFAESYDEAVAIIHLNTSWMCIDSNNEGGKLHIGLRGLYDCLHDENIKGKAIKIAIGHHPIADFKTSVGNSIKSLFSSKGVDFYLGGHCHVSSVGYNMSGKFEFCYCRQTRAEDSSYPAGFVVGEINDESDSSNLQFHTWDSGLAKFTYDDTLDSVTHGKYYIQNPKFVKRSLYNREIIVDFKLSNILTNYDSVIEKFNLVDVKIYRIPLRDIWPKYDIEWDNCIKEVENLYKSVIESSAKTIHIFPIAPIPLLFAFGYFMQNNNNNIRIYQYIENINEWVLDESSDNICPVVNMEKNIFGDNKRILAVSISMSAQIEKVDISEILDDRYDLLSIGISNPRLSALKYFDDIQTVKHALKQNLDKIIMEYEEIHLFLAAPAALCIEVGRIIRINMYPNTYIYEYNRTRSPKYIKIFDTCSLSKYF